MTCPPPARPARGLRSAIGIGLGLVFAGCAGNGEAKDPSRALEPRDTSLEHEPCDLDASGAKSFDADGDGRPELVQVMDGGRELCRAVDFNRDGVIDVFVYFDERGQQRRRESGFDRDTLPDEVSVYENGTLVRKERETNNDRKIDTWDYYENGLLVREERDSTGDGFVDQWWAFNRPDDTSCAVVTTDGDGDGKPDASSALDICADKNPAAKAKAPAPAEPKSDEGDEGEGGEVSPPPATDSVTTPEAAPGGDPAPAGDSAPTPGAGAGGGAP